MISLDTETTGLNLHHGCRPFFVSTCSDKGKLRWWEWDVNPKTREPIIPEEDRAQIRNYLAKQKRIVYHNAKFDIRALDRIGIAPPDWGKVHCTLIGHHVLASAQSHKLKDLALGLLDIEDDDLTDLIEASNKARRIGKKHGWRVAKPLDPHFPALKRFAKKDPGWCFDTWLPRAVAKQEKYPTKLIRDTKSINGRKLLLGRHPWWDVLKKYGLRDAERTIALWQLIEDGLKSEGLWKLYLVRRKLLEITYRMEETGITLDPKRLEAVSEDFAAETLHSQKICWSTSAGHIDNLASPKQLQGALFGYFKLKPAGQTEKSNPNNPTFSTDKDALQIIQAQVPSKSKAYQFIKHLGKVRQYGRAVDSLQSYGLSSRRGHIVYTNKPAYTYYRLHPNFNITGTATTRFSSHDPNAQNISKQEAVNLRQVFGPLPGSVWYAADYSNIELRILAYESGEKELIRAFEAGESVHMVIAEQLLPDMVRRLGHAKFKKTERYQWIKNGNFSIVYGASEKRADATYRIPGAYRKIRKTFTQVSKFMDFKGKEGRDKGYVTCLGGYRLQVPGKKPYVSLNYFIQGSAGWALIKAMIRCDEYLQDLGPGHDMIMCVHDELVFSFKKSRTNFGKVRELKRLMEMSGNDIGLPTPVEIDIIKTNWAEGKELELAA